MATNKPVGTTGTAPTSATKLQVTVRLYRQGFGDCFLLTFRRGPDVRHMLIDCGVLKGDSAGEDRIKDVVANIKETVRGRLDLLVVTHEHWDHVSGFLQAQEIFDGIEVGKVWLAWTEDPKDPLATDIRNSRALEIAALTAAYEQVKDNKELWLGNDEAPDIWTKINDVLGFFGDTSTAASVADVAEATSQLGVDAEGAKKKDAGSAGKGNSTQAALNYIKERNDWEKVYLRPGTTQSLPGVEGVRFHVLGPPEDLEAIRRTESEREGVLYEYGPSVEDSFRLALLPAEVIASNPLTNRDYLKVDRCYPFDQHYCISEDDLRRDAAKAAEAEKANKEQKNAPVQADGTDVDFFRKHYGFTESDNDLAPPWRRIAGDWLLGAGDFALALDSATNNTSLALAIELVGSGKVLLFPGDAQVGNWQSWKKYEWTLEEESGTGEPKKVKIADLLGRTVLYKVSHHGSHNGTLRNDGLELMNNSELVALIPVNQEVAKHKGKSGWNMPFPSLAYRLKEKTRGRIIRTDTGMPDRKDCQDLSDTEWAKFNQNTPVPPDTDLYIDCIIEDSKEQ